MAAKSTVTKLEIENEALRALSIKLGSDCIDECRVIFG